MRPWRERLAAWTPMLLLAPSLGASLIYVFGFTLWTCWISVSSSTLLPQYDFVGFKAYLDRISFVNQAGPGIGISRSSNS